MRIGILTPVLGDASADKGTSAGDHLLLDTLPYADEIRNYMFP